RGSTTRRTRDGRPNPGASPSPNPAGTGSSAGPAPEPTGLPATRRPGDSTVEPDPEPVGDVTEKTWEPERRAGHRRGVDGIGPTEVTDGDLWQKAAKGDPSAFGALFERHADAVYNHCFRRTGSWEAAEDLTSVVFLEAWRR